MTDGPDETHPDHDGGRNLPVEEKPMPNPVVAVRPQDFRITASQRMKLRNSAGDFEDAAQVVMQFGPKYGGALTFMCPESEQDVVCELLNKAMEKGIVFMGLTN